MENLDFLMERYDLAKGRLAEIAQEDFADQALKGYFGQCVDWLKLMCTNYERLEQGLYETEGLETLKQWNHEMYEDIMVDNYDHSYANPDYAVSVLGEEMGQLLCVIYTELRSLIVPVFAKDLEMLVIYMELFIEIYHSFEDAMAETGKLPDKETIRQIFYWFVSDYADIAAERAVAAQVDPSVGYGRDIVMNCDLADPRYLFRYGSHVTDNEIRMSQYLNSLPAGRIKLMADTYTEGYRIGFEMTGKDLSKKKTATVIFPIGFEAMVRQAVLNLEAIGLQALMGRGVMSLLQGSVGGFFGNDPNEQYGFDHKDDIALVFDKALIQRKLEVRKNAFEDNKEWAAYLAGPAVIETFGKEPFSPVPKANACRLSSQQQAMQVEFRSQSMMLQMQYINPEERSFTIIAFPDTHIGEQFETIFDEVIGLNTLDYKLYQGIQQTIIDALDTAQTVRIKGMNGNHTDLSVAMYEMKDPSKETIFENCVADVNIPVGEVFTSPKLKGTNGVLHVTKVFLNGLEYKDLSIQFVDGMIGEYSCSNFAEAEEGKKYIKENILANHETLPLGEFAIGTNTTAYVVGRKYDIAAKLPILIAEKTGPHFAVGDTCYSHEEDLVTYNPDGKQIVARENEVSALRKTDPAKAYLNCHTDITIPYDELGELTAVRADGSEICIIKEGRFVLPGCEQLNLPLENN